MISKDSFKNGVAPAMKMKMACLTLKQVILLDLTEEVVFKNNCCLTLCKFKVNYFNLVICLLLSPLFELLLTDPLPLTSDNNRMDFSLPNQYNIKQTGDENREKYQWGVY